MIEVNKHVPARLLEPCPAPKGTVVTARDALVMLPKTQKQLACANGKITTISDIIH